jgi:Adenylate and Guanylate cyclase catalytic domain
MLVSNILSCRLDIPARSNAIISSLFPTQVRERLFAERAAGTNAAPKTKLKNMLTSGNFIDANLDDDDDDSDFMYKSKPIADLFAETTILFADIAGFTAWSSSREPSQVFILLETLFRSFDEIAKKRRAFKVETVGDCYVAVIGLPDPRKDHAEAMARFADDCMTRMRWLSKKLEVTLGKIDSTCCSQSHQPPLSHSLAAFPNQRSRYGRLGHAHGHSFRSRDGRCIAW